MLEQFLFERALLEFEYQKLINKIVIAKKEFGCYPREFMEEACTLKNSISLLDITIMMERIRNNVIFEQSAIPIYDDNYLLIIIELAKSSKVGEETNKELLQRLLVLNRHILISDIDNLLLESNKSKKIC